MDGDLYEYGVQIGSFRGVLGRFGETQGHLAASRRMRPCASPRRDTRYVSGARPRNRTGAHLQREGGDKVSQAIPGIGRAHGHDGPHLG